MLLDLRRIHDPSIGNPTKRNNRLLRGYEATVMNKLPHPWTYPLGLESRVSAGMWPRLTGRGIAP